MVKSAETFGKYTLLDKVAVGGMAEIYRAKTQGIGGFEKLLAIKRLHPQFGEQFDVAQMLVDEARIAVHLTHPNIAEIFDLGCIRDQYFIAMEYIDGVDLHHIKKHGARLDGGVPEATVIYVMAEVLAGLHYAHTRSSHDGAPLQIVHRDVSPQNIMVSYEGQVKLVDFGIAKAELRAQEETQNGIIKGKFYYMSPEQAHGQPIDRRADIFAAGMVIYEMLAGKSPYAHIDEYELLKAVRETDFPGLSTVLPSVDPALESIVSRATHQEPDRRYRTARDMQNALMEYLDSHHRPYRRRELAQFVQRASGDHQSPTDTSDMMSRRDYEATEASVIFEAGRSISDEAIFGAAEGERAPFEQADPTRVWKPEADVPDDASSAAEDRMARSEGPHRGDLRSSGSVPPPAAPTAPNKLPWWERTMPGVVNRTHVIFGSLGLLIVSLAGLLAFLIADSGGADEASKMPSPAMAVDQMGDDPPEASHETVSPTVNVRVTTTPPGSTTRLDGAPVGHTPIELPELSTGKTYELEVSQAGFQTVQRTIQPTTHTDTLHVELPRGGAVLQVTTYPTDAQIVVDGRQIGRSPVDVAGLDKTTSHQLQASLDGGRSTSRSVEWTHSDGRVKQVEIKFDSPEKSAHPAIDHDSKLSPDSDHDSNSNKPARRRKPDHLHAHHKKGGHPSRPQSGRSDKSDASSGQSQTLNVWGKSDAESATEEPGAKPSSTPEQEGLNIWGDDGDKLSGDGH